MLGMANRPLPSDPDLLLKLIDEIDSDDSDDGWDGFVDEGDEELMTGWNKRHEEFEVVEQRRDGQGMSRGLDNGMEEMEEIEVDGMEGSEETGTGSMDTQNAHGGERSSVGENDTEEVHVGEMGGEEMGEERSQENRDRGERSDESESEHSSDRGNSSIPPFTKQPGVVPDMVGKEPIDCFNLFFTNSTFDTILEEKNRY